LPRDLDTLNRFRSEFFSFLIPSNKKEKWLPRPGRRKPSRNYSRPKAYELFFHVQATKTAPRAVPYAVQTRSRSYPVPGSVLGLKLSSHRICPLSRAVLQSELLTCRYGYNPRIRLLRLARLTPQVRIFLTTNYQKLKASPPGEGESLFKEIIYLIYSESYPCITDNPLSEGSG
jgi:hypothetical protein